MRYRQPVHLPFLQVGKEQHCLRPMHPLPSQQQQRQSVPPAHTQHPTSPQFQRYQDYQQSQQKRQRLQRPSPAQLLQGLRRASQEQTITGGSPTRMHPVTHAQPCSPPHIEATPTRSALPEGFVNRDPSARPGESLLCHFQTLDFGNRADYS